jgi:hypothetical protein
VGVGVGRGKLFEKEKKERSRGFKTLRPVSFKNHVVFPYVPLIISNEAAIDLIFFSFLRKHQGSLP